MKRVTMTSSESIGPSGRTVGVENVDNVEVETEAKVTQYAFSRYHDDCYTVRIFRDAWDHEDHANIPPVGISSTPAAAIPHIEDHPPLELDERVIMRLMNDTKRALLISGPGGAGKSHLLRRVLSMIDPSTYALTAPTGKAAQNIGGQTIYRAAGLGLMKDSAISYSTMLKRPGAANRYASAYNFFTKLKLLVIDEISMLNPEVYVKLDIIFRRVRGSDLPFGGVKMMYVGDFLQLPPVSKGTEASLSVFQTALWKRMPMARVFLCRSYRQAEGSEFLGLLNRLRFGNMTHSDHRFLKGLVGKPHKVKMEGCDLEYIQLHTHRASVSDVNERRLLSFEKPGTPCTHFEHIKRFMPKVFYQACVEGRPVSKVDARDCMYKKNKPSEYDKLFPVVNVNLAVGCQILLKCNAYANLGLYNGSIGMVREIGNDSIKVEFYDGATSQMVEILRHKFKYRVGLTAELVCQQFPLVLGYAATIHSAQSMSLTHALIDPSRCFTTGQLYTACSRMTGPEGLSLVSYDPRAEMACPDAARYETVETDPAKPIFVAERVTE